MKKVMLVLILISSIIYAKDMPNIYTSAGFGTLGANVSLATDIKKNLLVKLDFNTLYYNNQDVVINSLALSNMGLLADYRPFNGIFGLVGGLYASSNKLEVQNMLNMKLLVNGVIPYLGITFSKKINKRGLGFYFDLGVLMSSPRLVTDADGIPKADEQLQELRDQISANIPVIPVMKFGVSYTLKYK